jgi:adsorption protein A
MKQAPRMLALALALVSCGVTAQTMDFGPEVKPFLRFRLYPHIDKAFEAQSKGDGQRAIAEMEQAQRLAPDNVPIALELAAMYARFGQSGKGESMLLALRRKHPQDARIGQALARLPSQAVPLALPAAPAVPVPVAPAPVPVLSGTDAAPVSSSQASVPAARATTDRSVRSRPSNALRAAAPARSKAMRTEMAPGYEAASAAYAAMDRNDVQRALQHARQAAAEAPDNTDYQRLLAYVLVENGQLDEAQAWMSRMDLVADPASANQLQALEQSVRERRAYAAFDAALQARQRGNTAEALQQAQAAVALAPQSLPFRLQWLGLLFSAQQYAQVQQVAEEGLALRDDAAVRVMRAAALQAQGHNGEAVQAFDQALAMPVQTPLELQNYRLVAMDAALGARQFDRAAALLQQLEASPAPALGGRAAELKAARERTLSPAAMYATHWRPPVVNCYGSGGVAGCDVWPGMAKEDPSLVAGQEAYRLYSLREFAQAAEIARKATELHPQHLPYRLLRLQALVASGEQDKALAEVQQTLDSTQAAEGQAQATEIAEVLAFRSRVLYAQGRRSEAAADAQAALQVPGLSLSSEVDLLLQEGRPDEARAAFDRAMLTPTFANSADPELAYLATRVGDDRTALTLFDRSRAQGRLPLTSLRDGAYTASREAQTERSVDYFTAAIDASDAGDLALTPREHFSTRREVADRTRNWGVNGLLGYRGITPGTVGTQPAVYGDVAQVVAEAYWRPQGFRDGSFWEVYAAVAQNVYSREGGSTGSETTQGALGIRAKPLRDHNLVLSLEKRFKIGSLAYDDWLVRLGYSGGRGTDLRIDVPNWTTVNVYAEAGRLLQARQDYVTFEAQAGRSFRMGDADARLVLFPHVVLGVDYNSVRTAQGYNGAAGAGVGVGARYWLRENAHNAPRSYLDLSLQYRARLAGDERGKGVFVRLAWVY